jgi:succinate dehydrogenase / fumarate reductase cytochrome b subunit
MAANPSPPPARPLSPHLTIWRWGPNMVVSILHRATGTALTFAGLGLLTWWLLAIAGDAGGYATFAKAASNPIGIIVLVGLTWSFFQHLLSGIRHLVTDTGEGLELSPNKMSANATIIGAIILTAALWVYLLEARP